KGLSMIQKILMLVVLLMMFQNAAFCAPQVLTDDDLDEINAGAFYDAGLLALLEQAQLDLSSLINLNTVQSANSIQINMLTAVDQNGSITQSNHATVMHR
ncbi:MAG: hypothetical protein KC713_05685, partial [Candidatus Omnitrophica bacterium]|nr:hypothetical protein [Candidatus Omnitrophota bacterium]